MKCLEKDRTRRYATANGLATDIARHLNNEPIAARPPSRLYRFQKSIQRNKLAFGAATAVALTLVIGFAVSTAMYFKAQGEKKRAQIEAAKAYGVAQFFKDMVDATAPNLVHGRDITPLRDMLNRTADRISRDLNAQPEVEVDVRRTLGVAYQILRQYPQAEGMYRQGLAVARKHFGNEHSEVAKSLNDLGFIVTQRDEFEEAEKLFREALEIHRKLRRKVDSDLAFSLNGLGIVLKGQGKLMEAETLFRQALEMRRKLFGNDNHMTSNAIGNLAGALAAQGQLAEAEALYRETIAIARNHHEGDHDTPPKLKGLAELLQKTGRLAEAEGLLREALRMERNLFGEGHPSVAKTLDRLVALLKEEGKEAEARALFESQTNLATDKKSEPR
jgi:tetratricopeptide (TPR) repeat protein